MIVSDIGNSPPGFSIDRDSLYLAMGASYGNCFCGLAAINGDGENLLPSVLYLAPYTHAANRPKWDRTTVAGKTEYQYDNARCGGVTLKNSFQNGKIYHQEGGIAGHEQLASFLNEKAKIKPLHGWLGFSLLYSGSKEGFGGTSRSQNNQHFREWRSGQRDAAYSAYHKELEGKLGPPTFHDVTVPGRGEKLSPKWSSAIKKALIDGLGKDYVSSIAAKIGNSQKGAAQPPKAPPPPPN